MKKPMKSKQVHILLQGKGGCGKSYIAMIFALYYKFFKRKSVKILDIDQVNATLTQYKKLNVEHIRITDTNNINEIDSRQLDDIVQKIVDVEEEIVLLDTGSNTFLNLLDYIIQNQVFDILYGMDIKVFVHTVIVGSGDYNDTLHGAKTIIENLSVPVIIWVNEFYGKVIEELNKSILCDADYTHAKSIAAYILLAKQNPKLQGKDLEILVTNRLTLPEIDTSPLFSLVSRVRLRKYFQDIFSSLDAIPELLTDEENLV